MEGNVVKYWNHIFSKAKVVQTKIQTTSYAITETVFHAHALESVLFQVLASLSVW